MTGPRAALDAATSLGTSETLPADCLACGAQSAGEIAGIPFRAVPRDRFVAILESCGICVRSHRIHFLAAHPTTVARRDAVYRRLLAEADVVIADGGPVALTLRLARGEEVRRFPGVEALCLGLERARLRHYFVGGSPETALLLRRQIESTYPDAAVVGIESPPFRPLTDEEWSALAERIRAAETEVVWIGLGAPKQDFAAEELRARNAAPAIVTVGAAFDFLAGSRRRAPRWLQRTGLEWFYRFAQEPRRLWRRYLIGNTAFVAGAAVDVVSTRWSRR